ncbi:MAG: hypothetical protein PF501_13620, partial [Salinisphaera sp.]|nr:hypothetical protein [Salinisphaera sp.]
RVLDIYDQSSGNQRSLCCSIRISVTFLIRSQAMRDLLDRESWGAESGYDYQLFRRCLNSALRATERSAGVDNAERISGPPNSEGEPSPGV